MNTRKWPTAAVNTQSSRRQALAAAAGMMLTASHAQRRQDMKATAVGTFVVQMKPQAEPVTSEGVSLGRMALDKTFEGDFVGVGKGEMLTALTPTKGSAGYVAIERVTGRLHGKEGTFVLQHSGTMDKGSQQLSIAVVPDSGTGALLGISGTFRLRIEGGRHNYELEYSLAP